MKTIMMLAASVCALTAVSAQAARINPPPTSDTTFVADDGSGLDTGCTYRNGGPLRIEVPIDRYVGEVDTDGHLVNLNDLIANHVIGDKAYVRLPAWDIDINGGGSSYAPEHDRLFINGQDMGLLTGDNQIWKLNEFQVSVEHLKFPSMGANGNTPTPAINEIQINIDESNTDLVWCMAVDWVEISFEAMSPMLLVHGTNAQSDSWEPVFTDYLHNHHIPFSNDIDLVANGSIDGNARLLKSRVQALADSFGVDHVHVVSHSKGGLDSRRFLSTYYNPNPPNGEPEVLSLYTITTPHHGTILSDLSVANRTYNDPQSNDPIVQEYLDNDWWANAFGKGPQNPALTEQTTYNIATFNVNNPFTNGANFYTFSADADLDNDGAISRDEATPLVPDSVFYDEGEVGTLLYRVLGNVASISVTRHTNLLGLNEWHVITPTAPPSFQHNDLVVTVESARHPSGHELLSADRNHSTAKDGATAQKILGQIQQDFPVQ
ncbi:MAG: alpha/beta hydrolase [Chromatiales bacterium]